MPDKISVSCLLEGPNFAILSWNEDLVVEGKIYKIPTISISHI